MVVYWTNMAITGNGELGFDYGEGAVINKHSDKERTGPQLQGSVLPFAP